MKTIKFLYLIPAALGLSLAGAFADTACSPAIGFNKVECLGNSDTLIAVPFDQKPVFVGSLSAVPTSTATTAVLTPTGVVSWSNDEFALTHYVRFTSGVKTGFYYTVSGNGAGTLTIDLNDDSVSGVAQGDTFALLTYWTLASLFPAGEGVHASATAGNRATEIFVPNNEGLGENKPPTDTFYFRNGAWKKVGDLAGVYDSRVLVPGSALWVRHNISTATTVCVSGRVPSAVHAIQIDVNSGASKNDMFISLDRPVPVTLAESGLVESGAFLPSVSAGNRTDELFVYNNAQAQFNKPPSATYYYLSGNWKKVGSLAGIFNDEEVFSPGSAVVIRKTGNGAATPSTVFGLNNPNY